MLLSLQVPRIPASHLSSRAFSHRELTLLIISVVIGRMGLCVLLDHHEDEVGYSRGAQRDAVRVGVLVTFLSSPSS